jgi:hypothetical protein
MKPNNENYFGKNLDVILDKILLKIDLIKNNMEMITYNYKNNRSINLEFLEQLQIISENVDLMTDKTRDIYEKYLEIIPIEDLSFEEKVIVKNNLINEKIKETLLPLMILLRLKLENE